MGIEEGRGWKEASEEAWEEGGMMGGWMEEEEEGMGC